MATNEQSTLAVSKEIADKVREVTKESGSTTFDVANRLLAFALEHAEIEIEVKIIKLKPAELLKKGGKK